MLPDLILRQLEIEGISVTEDSSMVRRPAANPEPIPRLAVYRHDGGFALLFRGDVGPAERATVRDLGAERAFSAAGAALGTSEREHFVTCTFERPPSSEAFAGVVEDEDGWAIYVDGVRASRAFSSREGPRAAELAVATEPAFRRRGFARRVASAWAAAKLGEGKVAFYSYSAANLPSARLAERLGVRERFEVVTYS